MKGVWCFQTVTVGDDQCASYFFLSILCWIHAYITVSYRCVQLLYADWSNLSIFSNSHTHSFDLVLLWGSLDLVRIRCFTTVSQAYQVLMIISCFQSVIMIISWRPKSRARLELTILKLWIVCGDGCRMSLQSCRTLVDCLHVRGWHACPLTLNSRRCVCDSSLTGYNDTVWLLRPGQKTSRSCCLVRHKTLPLKS